VDCSRSMSCVCGGVSIEDQCEVCVCMCVRTYVRVYQGGCVCLRRARMRQDECMHALPMWVYTMYECVYVCMHACMYVMCVCMYVCTYVYMHVRVCMCVSMFVCGVSPDLEPEGRVEEAAVAVHEVEG
jgi:hypothetical protein